MVELYTQISLKQDFPKHNLKQGDIATFIDIVPHPEGGEEGYVLEVFNALGESINTVVVPKSAVAPLTSNEVLSVRSLVKA